MKRSSLLVAMLFVVVICVLVMTRTPSSEARALQPAATVDVTSTRADVDLTQSETPWIADRKIAVENVLPKPIVASGTPTFALVKVLVVEDGTRKPLVGAQVYSLERLPRRGALAITKSTASRGGIVQYLMTDSAGRVEIEVPPCTEIVVIADASKLGAGAAEGAPPVLKVGETFELVLAVKTGDDSVFWCRVVDDTSIAPIAGATLHAASAADSPVIATTDAAGLLTIPTTSWAPRVHRIDVPDHSFAYITSVTGHETADRALDVALPRSATLRARVVAASGQSVAHAHIKFVTKLRFVVRPPGDHTARGSGSSDPTWESWTDADGGAVPLELPSRAALTVSIDAGRVSWESPEPLVLKPGETRDVEWTVDAGCRVTGHCIDQFGKPVVSQPMRMETGFGSTPVYFQDFVTGQVKQAITDADGRFEFQGVSVGAWFIGPEPHISTALRPPAVVAPVADEVAPIAQRIEIGASDTDREIDLRVDRGLAIRGRVLDSKGNPSRGGRVHAEVEPKSLMTSVKYGRDGTFTLGPIAAGRYRLRAESRAPGESDAKSEAVSAETGETDVVLRLRPGVTLAGRVVDERGEPVSASMLISRNGPDGSHNEFFATKPDGAFNLSNSEPGTFVIAATQADGRVGVLEDITLESGNALTDLVVRLAPGGRIRVTYDGADRYALVSVRRGRVLVGQSMLEAGTVQEFSAPLGRVTVNVDSEGRHKTAEKTVEVTSGATCDVAFDLESR